MDVYRLNGGHWYADLKNVWVFLVRARCTCGWTTRPCFTMDGAANALILHQALQGERIT